MVSDINPSFSEATVSRQDDDGDGGLGKPPPDNGGGRFIPFSSVWTQMIGDEPLSHMQ